MRPVEASTQGRYAERDAAEAHFLRMWRLQDMDSGELRARLGDPAEAAAWIESAARYGSPQAQLRLGQMRLDGMGAPRDEAQALKWFARAAEAGAPEAMNMLGRCHENGWGVEEDLAAAAGWYRAAAEQGYDWGEYNYANMLFDGRGAEQDEAAAVLWYRRAADQGHGRAMNLLARCYEEGWGVAVDRACAYDWYRRSAETGYFRAQYNFATLLAAQGRIDQAAALFATALSQATAESRPALIEALRTHPHPRLAEVARCAAGEDRAA